MQRALGFDLNGVYLSFGLKVAGGHGSGRAGGRLPTSVGHGKWMELVTAWTVD